MNVILQHPKIEHYLFTNIELKELNANECNTATS